MNIGIDGNEANQRNKVGVGQFAFNVICQLEKIDKENQYFVYLKEPPLADLPCERNGWKYLVFGPGKFWTQFALPLKLFTQKEKLNVFYSPSHYAPRFSPVPTVVSIMDLWHHRHPEQFAKKDLYQLTKWESYSVKKASHIITISEFSKKEIIDVYKVPEGRVTVAYPGYTEFKVKSSRLFDGQAKCKVEEVEKKYNIVGDYFLYLGTLQPKKNIEGLIKAFNLLVSQYPNISLVVAGKKGWLFERIFALVRELHLEEKVIFTGFVDEEEKPYLIAGAKAFVLPSFYEGFGIPVLEAMNLGVPVVISNAGSLPEAGGGAAIYCDPEKIESITGALEEVLNLNEKQRNEIIDKGLKQAARFNWKDCAEKILKILNKVGGKNVER